jgi:hypothetical protein
MDGLNSQPPDPRKYTNNRRVLDAEVEAIIAYRHLHKEEGYATIRRHLVYWYDRQTVKAKLTGYPSQTVFCLTNFGR